jgi:hypothetical protein
VARRQGDGDGKNTCILHTCGHRRGGKAAEKPGCNEDTCGKKHNRSERYGATYCRARCGKRTGDPAHEETDASDGECEGDGEGRSGEAAMMGRGEEGRPKDGRDRPKDANGSKPRGEERLRFGGAVAREGAEPVAGASGQRDAKDGEREGRTGEHRNQEERRPAHALGEPRGGEDGGGQRGGGTGEGERPEMDERRLRGALDGACVLVALVGIVVGRGGEGRHRAFLHRARGRCIAFGEEAHDILNLRSLLTAIATNWATLIAAL